jgi:hypothetical protein
MTPASPQLVQRSTKTSARGTWLDSLLSKQRRRRRRRKKQKTNANQSRNASRRPSFTTFFASQRCVARREDTHASSAMQRKGHRPDPRPHTLPRRRPKRFDAILFVSMFFLPCLSSCVESSLRCSQGSNASGRCCFLGSFSGRRTRERESSSCAPPASQRRSRARHRERRESEKQKAKALSRSSLFFVPLSVKLFPRSLRRERERELPSTFPPPPRPLQLSRTLFLLRRGRSSFTELCFQEKRELAPRRRVFPFPPKGKKEDNSASSLVKRRRRRPKQFPFSTTNTKPHVFSRPARGSRRPPRRTARHDAQGLDAHLCRGADLNKGKIILFLFFPFLSSWHVSSPSFPPHCRARFFFLFLLQREQTNARC